VSAGWLALLGGGEFSFGETEAADEAWLEQAGDGPVGFVPAASGSDDYGRHFAAYLSERFGREVETIPVYRPRDARRGRNAERLGSVAAVYVGGGVADHLVETLEETPALAALAGRLASGGVVVAIGAAAQACGELFRPIRGGRPRRGLGLAEGLVIEPNFDPGHIGLPAGSALLLGSAGAFEAVGDVFVLAEPDADVVPMVAPG